MKLIIKEYLASLKERGELDVVLPDLLSQMGLNVYSLPGRGTRQDGVDVAAVGSIDGGFEKVYLFSIKPGDLKRRDWDSDSVQSLRPSLNQIQDSYIPHRLPPEHRGKEIVICIAIGGNVEEQLRPDLTGYIDRNSRRNISFEEWNGDKIASLIQSNFLREDLLPDNSRSRLRKSLALLDEPEVSYRYFAELIQSLSENEKNDEVQQVTAIRQLSICLWVLFAWARDAENTESAFLSSEFTLLHAWNIAKSFAGKETKAAKEVARAFSSIYSAYHQICNEYLQRNVFPYVEIYHGVSSAVRSTSNLDINLKLFDVLGRLATDGIWSYWNVLRLGENENENENENESEIRNKNINDIKKCAFSIRALISNNPVLLLPIKDEQAIDIFISTYLLSLVPENHDFIRDWHREIIERARFSYEVNGSYPCTLRTYLDLLEHPKNRDNDYRKDVTNASILYPILALWSALLDDDKTYEKVSLFKKELLQHCTFQFWFLDDDSEAHFYINSDIHGAALADITLEQSKEDFLTKIFEECKLTPQFHDLSAVKYSWEPLVFVACRHYKLPLPLHLLEGFRKEPVTKNDPL